MSDVKNSLNDIENHLRYNGHASVVSWLIGYAVLFIILALSDKESGYALALGGGPAITAFVGELFWDRHIRKTFRKYQG